MERTRPPDDILKGPKQIGNDTASSLEQAISRSQQGDVWAFRQLVECYQQYAFSLAFRIVCNEDDARDIVQEAFIRVWNHIKGYSADVKFSTWLYKIVVNLSYDRVKSEGRKTRLFTRMPAEADLQYEESGPAADSRIMNRDLADRIKAIAQKLPPRQRMVFVLRDLQDLTVEEVSEILEVSRESVKTNLCYARRSIRIALERLGVQK